MARYLIGMTGASGAIHGVDFVKRCPGEKYLILSDWARHVLHTELDLKPSDLEPHVKKLFSDSDLAAPFSSGSNRYDAFVIVPCSVSTLACVKPIESRPSLRGARPSCTIASAVRFTA